jgi:hypothetical protein
VFEQPHEATKRLDHDKARLIQATAPQCHAACKRRLHSFIHVTPVAEAHLSNASPFQTPLITPNNKLIKPTNKGNFLPG